MKLFLASSLDKTLGLFKEKLNNEKHKVVFIANAADPYTDPWWVDTDRKAFIKEGFDIKEVDLRKIDAAQLNAELNQSDIIHICGGSVFYLLNILKQKGFDKVIIDAVRNDKIIYTGTSAGSIITSVSNEIYKYDPEESKYSNLLKDYSGLGFVKFLIVPHCNNPDFIEANKAVVEQIPKYREPLFLLNDNHAISVENDQFELLILNS